MNCIKCGAVLQENAMFCHICGKKQVVQEKKIKRTRSNGTGAVYKRGNVWECAVVLGYVVQPNGSVKTIRKSKSGFKTKKEAIDYIPNLKLESISRTPTMLDLYTRFKASQKFLKLSDSRKEKYDIAWKKLELYWLSKIDSLTTFDLQNAVDSVADTYYTARDIKNLFSKLYQLALPDQIVKANLSEYIELPEKVEKQQQAFSNEEITNLWNDYCSGNWWTGYLLLMIYTGMMPGELLGCRKEYINWEGKQIIGAGIKTKERKQTPIVLADILLPVVAELCEHTEGEKLIRINKDNFYDVYYETLERAKCRRLTPYACRHTAATALALENIPPSVIQKIMRHAKYSTTEKYIHINLDPMLEAVNKLAQKRKTEKE